MTERLGNDASHDIGHFRRVWRNVEAIQAVEGGDLEILVAAAWLHDLVNPPKDSPDRKRASQLSAEAAAPALRDLGFPEAKVAPVQHAILTHSFSAGIPPETREAMILQDADRLDAIGAIGVARCFYVAGRMDSALFDPDDPDANDRPLNDTLYALDHFKLKLFPIVQTLKTDAARKIAEKRVATMNAFVTELLAEIG